jgi:hypothetical protein
MQVLLRLRELPSYRVNHDFFLFENGEKRSLLAEGTLNLLSLPFALKLKLAQIVLEAFDLESQLVILSLEDPSHVSLLFDILGVLDD